MSVAQDQERLQLRPFPVVVRFSLRFKLACPSRTEFTLDILYHGRKAKSTLRFTNGATAHRRKTIGKTSTRDSRAFHICKCTWRGESSKPSFACRFCLFLIASQRVLDVIPADIPGMDYMTRTDVSGYEVRHYSTQTCCRGGN